MVWLSSVAIKYFFNPLRFRSKVDTYSGNHEKSVHFVPESPSTLERIRCPLCSGLSVHFGADWVSTLLRSMHMTWKLSKNM